ncbi:MAG TPA: molybdenum cofactor guanylyltransferase [Solirubrobacteraceae bacterium]
MGASRQLPVAAILAGGHGHRIGGGKAQVELAGRPLLEWAAATAGQVLAEVWVVAKPDTALPDLPGVSVLREPAEARHPVVGLVAALRAAQGRPVLVCAADMPFVHVDTLRALSEWPPGETVLATRSGRIEPLLGRYEPSALGALEAAAEAASAPLREVVGALGPVLLEVADPVELFNVNTPADLARAEAIVAERGRPG